MSCISSSWYILDGAQQKKEGKDSLGVSKKFKAVALQRMEETGERGKRREKSVNWGAPPKIL
jgi:hypothetical protein